MAHELSWIDEPWIMNVEYSKTIGAREVDEVMQICIDHADHHPIYFLVDVSGAERFEPDLLRLKSTIALLKHPHTHWFAYVGMNSVIRMAVQILMHYTGFKAFSNREDALAFLRDMVQHHVE